MVKHWKDYLNVTSRNLQARQREVAKRIRAGMAYCHLYKSLQNKKQGIEFQFPVFY